MRPLSKFATSITATDRITSKYEFLLGACNEFAFQLHLITGLKIGIITENRLIATKNELIEKEGLIHAFCIIGNSITRETECIDARGIRSFESILNEYTKYISEYTFYILDNPSNVLVFGCNSNVKNIKYKAVEYVKAYILPEMGDQNASSTN